MKPFCISLILFVIPLLLDAQKPQTITMDNNKISAEDVKPEIKYLFPSFQSGKVILNDFMVINCQLNYNMLFDEILYIDESGKEMALANPEDVSQVYISNRLFVTTPKGYFEVIEPEPVSLVYKWTCHITEKGKEGALGISTDAPSVYQMNQISFDAKTWKLDVDKEAIVSVEVIPYLKSGSNCIQVKGEKDFMRSFPGNNTEIKHYLNQNPVDFKKETDLRRLTIYCNSL